MIGHEVLQEASLQPRLGRAAECGWRGVRVHEVCGGGEGIVSTRQTLYRFWDGEGNLLYVGISVRPWDRWRQHAGDKPWWEEVASVTLESFATRSDVLAAELIAIRSEGPKYNIAGLARTALAPTSTPELESSDRCAPMIAFEGDWLYCACGKPDYDSRPDTSDYGMLPLPTPAYEAYVFDDRSWFDRQPFLLPEEYAGHVIAKLLGERFNSSTPVEEHA